MVVWAWLGMFGSGPAQYINLTPMWQVMVEKTPNLMILKCYEVDRIGSALNIVARRSVMGATLSGAEALVFVCACLLLPLTQLAEASVR